MWPSIARRRAAPAPARLRPGPLGVELGEEALRVLRFARTPDGELVRLHCAVRRYAGPRAELLAQPRRLRALLREALPGGPWPPVVTLLPPDRVRVLSVQYELHAAQSHDEAVLAAMADRLEGALAEHVIDYLPIRTRTDDGGHAALVAVAGRTEVVDWLEAWRRAGVQVSHLEIGPLALRRLVAAMMPPGRHDNVLVLNFGRTASWLTMLSGRRLLFDQRLALGEEGLLRSIAEALDTTAEQARELVRGYGLADAPPAPEAGLLVSGDEVAATLRDIVKPQLARLREAINQALIYAAAETRGAPVQRIHVLGALADWRGLVALLSDLVHIPVGLLDPLAAFAPVDDAPACAAAEGPWLALAAGLALRGLEAGDGD